MKSVWREILIAFLIGGIVGFFAATRLHHEHRHEGPRGNKGGQMLERFSKELGLNAEQKEKVGQILEANHEKFSTLREEMKPKFDEIKNSMKTDLAKVLTPEQQEKFKVLDAKWEARRKQMRLRRMD